MIFAQNGKILNGLFRFIRVRSIMDKSHVDQFINTMNDWGWTVNARIRFNKFIKAVSTNENLPEEIQKIYSLIDEVVLDKKAINL